MKTATQSPSKMTAEEFYDWTQRPENVEKYFELVRGKVIELPRPMKRHGVVCINIGVFLANYSSERRKGYVTGNDAGVVLERDPDTVRGPDLALYEDAQSFDELHPKYGEVPPRLAVEVLSENDRADRTFRKVTDYLNSGVDLVWVVDPEDRAVMVYRPDKGPRRVGGNEELTGENILLGLRCRVARFFVVPGETPEPKPQTRKNRRSRPGG